MPEPVTAEQFFAPKLKKQTPAFDPADHIVLFTFDDNYVDQTINLILSIAKFHPQGVSYVCLCPPLRPEHVDLLLSLDVGLQLRCYAFHVDMASGRWVTSAVLRLFTPWLLEEEITRVLYLDSDILCTGSLQDLFDTDVPLLAMGAEISGNVSQIQQDTVRRSLPTQLYCNSGMVVFNLAALRQQYTFAQIFDGLSALQGKVVYLDQDFLNLFFQGRITFLNPFHYNFQAYELFHTPFYKSALANCRLIHFSVGKPWLYKTKLPFIRLYLRHSSWPPMIRRVRKTYLLSLLYSPIRQARHLLSPIKQFLLRNR